MVEGVLLGVAITWGSQIVWAVTRRIRRPRIKEIEPFCGCDHHVSMHDPKTNECHEQVEYWQGTFKHFRRCPCRRYTGPEPLSSYYAPELSG